ncbi:hypothetical protein JCM8547_008205 [Rhodosporidiobolus lusitaniae]
MPFPTLNEDVLRLVCQHVAAQAEADSSGGTQDDVGWFRRSSALRTLCLVNSQWRSVAQLELESRVICRPSNHRALLRAVKERGLGRRVRRLLGWRKVGEVDPATFDSFVEACEELEQLEVFDWTLSLHSLARMKNLKSLTLSRTKLYAGASSLVLPCCLEKLALHLVALDFADFSTLSQAGAGSVENLSLGSFYPGPGQLTEGPLLKWLPTVRDLDASSISLRADGWPLTFATDFDIVPPLLGHCERLEVLRLPVDHLSLALQHLPTFNFLQSLYLHPAIDPDFDDVLDWDEGLLALLDGFRMTALSQLKKVVVTGRETFSAGAGGIASTPLYEVQEAAKLRGIEVEVR